MQLYNVTISSLSISNSEVRFSVPVENWGHEIAKTSQFFVPIKFSLSDCNVGLGLERMRLNITFLNLELG